jgi:hypothetical protein
MIFGQGLYSEEVTIYPGTIDLFFSNRPGLRKTFA